MNWHTSSYTSGDGGNCVEVAETPEVVYVRDTKNRGHGSLTFPASEWTAFLADADRL
ncbi:hypothetical protein HDA32_002142 [Spinactinospora alkalitolerans]|uniref:DUF397 domain-containing protein n=1 Tax=Spinactinospora alkalitolerans TaxID=687207 RepID=A0A852TVY6_9ACTN|nr:DUF397 domain-containing protein [Spinactinospora alkalitolerans]NYE47022.1 hypothetical protein [Spinactinospora alkalitolerans]